MGASHQIMSGRAYGVVLVIVILAATVYLKGGLMQSNLENSLPSDDCEVKSPQRTSYDVALKDAFEGGPKCYKMKGRGGTLHPMNNKTIAVARWKDCCHMCHEKLVDGCYMWTYKNHRCFLFTMAEAHYTHADGWVFGEYAGLLRIKPATNSRESIQRHDYPGPVCSFKHGRLRGSQITNGSFGVLNWEHCCTECRRRRGDGCLYWTYADMECELLRTKGFLDTEEGNPEVWQWGRIGGCNDGPYVINMDCFHHLHGIGNQFWRIKIDVLYSIAANLTRIETDGCYAANSRYGYGSDLSHFFGFGAYDECTIEDLRWSIEQNYMTMVDYQIPRYPRHWTDAIVEYIDDPSSKPKRNSFLEVALRPELRSPTTVFRLFGEQTKVATWERVQGWVSEKYESAFQDQGRQLFLFKGSRPIRFVIHGRRGDRYKDRRLTEEYYMNVTLNAFKAIPELHQTASIFLFSDGILNEWKAFMRQFPNATLSALDSPEIVNYPRYAQEHMSQTALDHMAHASILVTSKSSFSNIAAAFNTDAIKLSVIHKDFDDVGVPNLVVVREEDASFDVEQFQRAYEILKNKLLDATMKLLE